MRFSLRGRSIRIKEYFFSIYFFKFLLDNGHFFLGTANWGKGILVWEEIRFWKRY